MTVSNARLAYADVIDELVNDAPFLWVLRSLALRQPHYQVMDLAELEHRLQHQLDALFLEPQLAWNLICESLAFEEAGEAFVAAVFAFRSLEVDKIRHAVNAGLANAETRRGLVSALAWLPRRLIEAWMQKFYTSKDFSHKTLAMAVSAARREDPEDYLTRVFKREDCLENTALYVQALRCAGELKRQDLLGEVKNALNHDDPQVQFWALWAALLLGDHALVERLHSAVMTPDPLQSHAVSLAFRLLPRDLARQWIKQLIAQPENLRIAIQAVGVLGDPEGVKWLIAMMRSADHARVAGEAFSLITGIDLASHQLAIEVPDLAETLPDSGEPDSVALELDEDENLPWPNADKIAALWQTYGHRYPSPHRYLMGKEIAPHNFNYFEVNTRAKKAMRQGSGGFMQRQRHAAALELALSSASAPFFNVDARVSEA